MFERFDPPKDEYERGYNAYAKGTGESNPHEQGSDDFDDWRGGWNDACSDDD